MQNYNDHNPSELASDFIRPTPRNREIVSVLGAYGYTQDQLAALLRISVDDLLFIYSVELITGRSELDLLAIEGLKYHMQQGDKEMIKFYITNVHNNPDFQPISQNAAGFKKRDADVRSPIEIITQSPVVQRKVS